MVHSCLPRPCLGSRRELFQWPNPNPNPDPNPNQVWHAEVNFFHGDRRCGVVVYLQPPELDTAEADAEAPGAPATASGGEAARSPAPSARPSARLSEEPGGCSGARIERGDEAASAAASEASGRGKVATQHPSASMMAMSFRKAPLTLTLPRTLTLIFS